MKNWLIGLFLILSQVLHAQKQTTSKYTDECRRMVVQGDSIVKAKGKDSYKHALAKYNAAKVCDEGLAKEVNDKILALFNAIENEKNEALRQRDRAEKEKRKALNEKNSREYCEKQEKYIRLTNQGVNAFRDIERDYNELIVRLESESLTLDSLEVKYKKEVQLRNSNLTSLYHLLAVYTKNSKYEQGIETVNEILRKFPWLDVAKADRAYLFSQKKQYDLAISDFNDILEKGIDSSYFLLNRGISNFHLKRYGDAEMDFNKAIEMNKRTKDQDPFIWKGQVYFHRAQVYYALSQWEKAKFDYDKALSMDSTDFLSLIGRGQASFYLNEDDEALKYIRKGLHYNPDFSEGHTALAVYYQKQGKWKYALKECDIAAKISPNSPSPCLCKANIYESLHKIDSALVSINDALKLSKQEAPNLYLKRANIYVAKGDTALANRDVEKAISIGALNEGLHLSIAFFFFQKNQFDSAFHYFNLAINFNPKDFSAYYFRGRIFAKLMKWDLAKSDYIKSIRISPYPNSYIDLGEAWSMLNEPDSAIACIHQAIELDSTSFTIWHTSGRIWKELGEIQSAINALNRAISLNPQFGLPYFDRSNCFFATKQFDLALNDIDSFLVYHPNDVDGYVMKTKINYYQANWNDVIFSTTKCLSIDSNNHEMLYFRSIAYKMAGDYEKAHTDLSKLLKIPDQMPYAYAQRGDTYRRQKKYDLAAADIEKAIQLIPDWGSAYAFNAFLQASLNNEDGFYENLKLAVTALQTYPLKRFLAQGQEPVLQQYKDKARFQEILGLSKE